MIIAQNDFQIKWLPHQNVKAHSGKEKRREASLFALSESEDNLALSGRSKKEVITFG
jgi:hypothetical protein